MNVNWVEVYATHSAEGSKREHGDSATGVRSAKRYSAPISDDQLSEAAIEIAVDGGAQVGYGHMGRCLALWEELGDTAVFSVEDPVAARYLRARDAPIAQPVSPRLVVLDREKPAGPAEIRRLQRHGTRVCLIDDLGEARRYADLVVDPPTAAPWPPARRRLGGFEHVLLRREIQQARAGDRRPGEYVLLGIGGSDPAGLTPALTEALANEGIETAVALGPGYQGASPESGSLVPHGGWPRALSRARVLITGFGHSLLEAAYLGVPAVAVVFRDRHREHAQAFSSNATALWIDMTTGERAATLVSEVEALLADEDRRATMSRRGRELIDGRGAARVTAALRELL